MGSKGPRFRSVFHRTESSQVSGAGYLYGQAKQLIRAGDLEEALFITIRSIRILRTCMANPVTYQSLDMEVSAVP